MSRKDKKVPEQELPAVAVEDVDGRLDVELDDDEAVGHLQAYIQRREGL